MIKSTIEKQLISFCKGARLITKKLKHFIRADGKVGDDTIAQYLRGASFVSTGKGGTKHYYVSDIAERMCELSE